MFVWSAGGEAGGQRRCCLEASWRRHRPHHAGSHLQPLRSSHGDAASSLSVVSENIWFFNIKSKVQESVDVNISGEKLTNSQDAFCHEMTNQCQLFSNSHMMLKTTPLKKLISQSADNQINSVLTLRVNQHLLTWF